MNNINNNNNSNNNNTITISPVHVQYSLLHTENYKKEISVPLKDVLYKYNLLINEYLRFSLEKMFTMNKNYFKFIVIRGIETITHVFTILLIYTKNVDLAFYNSQKAYYLFNEFIEQIYDVQHLFLNLNSKDAIMYVYKKTIFDINPEQKRNVVIHPHEHDYFELLDIFTKMYKVAVEIIFELHNFDELYIKNNNEDDDYDDISKLLEKSKNNLSKDIINLGSVLFSLIDKETTNKEKIGKIMQSLEKEANTLFTSNENVVTSFTFDDVLKIITG